MEIGSGPTRYEIVVWGRLGRRFRYAFEDLEVEPSLGMTTLRGCFTDQAELHGVLNRLRDLGIELISVHAVD